jgi:phosphoglycerate dehydrogenase-like enzyme
VPDRLVEELGRRFPEVEFVAANDEEALAREAADAEVFFGFHFPEPLVPRAPRLRWIQSAGAGIERNLSPAVLARDVAVTNAGGLAAVAIAEHVIGLALVLCRNHHVAIRLQQEARWDRAAVMAGDGGPLREFAGSRMAILGLGPIGRAIAERAAALGATVRGLRRHPAGAVAPLEAVVGPDALHALLGWADFVVLAVPHTPETEAMIGPPELAAMRADAYLVNIARGSVVDEEALVDALRRRAIAGAALDVFREEPLPASNPLWTLPNVIVTPHVAGAMPRYFERALGLFAENLARYRAGQPLRNLVDKSAGYPVAQP